VRPRPNQSDDQTAGDVDRRSFVQSAAAGAAALAVGGPDRLQVPLEQILNLPIDLRVDFERLDDALTDLATLAPDKARVVELRYFAGLSIQETAEVLQIAPATVKRHWTFARVWLFRALGG
jgi:RNA polymerase sigma factor (sigma-70 family)